MLTLHQGNRLEVLVDRLADVLAVPPHDPLAPEHVVVQNVGMARWLSLELARRHGVCAHVRFALPGAFLWETWRRVLPEVPDASTLDPAVAAWRLFEILGTLERAPRFAAVHAWLGDAADEVRRHALARKLADLYDQYLLYRPQWIAQWETGEDARWQAELWRRVVARTREPHRAQLGQAFVAALARGGLVDEALPARLALFGVPSIPPAQLQAFAALGSRIAVHCFVLNPAQEHWSHVLPERTIAHVARAGDAAARHLETGHPLLASLGQQGRDVIDQLQELAVDTVDCWAEPGEDTLLHRVQADILHLHPRDAATRVPVAAADRSIALHACHSPMREVEVLHDRLLALFDAEPTLRPSDVVVMTPDVETYAPCVEAVFGTAPPGRRIPYAIADRSLRADTPLVDAFVRLLELPDGRWDAPSLLALLDVPALRRRFGLDETDLPQVHRWVREAAVRWGIDAGGRARLGLPATAEHTWRFGLDRLLLGWALPGGNRELDGDVLPLDEVEGSAARALGGLAAFAEAAFALDATLAAPRPPSAWATTLGGVVDAFFMPGPEDEEATAALRAACAAIDVAARAAGAETPVSRRLVAAEVRRQLDAATPRGRFLTGGVTVCAMVPMRSIPFAVVCLLGLGMASFPRSRRAPGFDLMADDRRRGDRSRRDDDRWLFLEAICSARHVLHLSWVGRGIRDNAEIPPSVVVSELLDVLERGFAPSPPFATLREQLEVVHPLQAFSRRYFGAGDDARLASYSEELAQASRALGGEPRRTVALAARSLPPPGPPADVGLDDLVDCLCHATRFFLRERLRIRLAADDAVLEDREPFALHGLAAWTVRSELLALRRDDVPPSRAERLLRARGLLPHAEVGRATFRQLAAEVDAFVARLAEAGAVGAEARRTLALPLGDGTTLAGTVGGLFAGGLVEWRLGRLRARDRLGVWVRHLLLQAADGGAACSLWVGTGPDDLLALGPVADAGARLRDLVALYREAHCRLLPLFPESACAYVAERRKGERRARWAAAEKWEGSEYHGGPGESEDAWNALAWRETDPLGDPEFVRLAERVFEPIFATEAGA